MMMSDREGNAFALVRIDDDFSKDPFASLPPSLSPLPLSLSISPLYFSLSLSLSAVSEKSLSPPSQLWSFKSETAEREREREK